MRLSKGEGLRGTTSLKDVTTRSPCGGVRDMRGGPRESDIVARDRGQRKVRWVWVWVWVWAWVRGQG